MSSFFVRAGAFSRVKWWGPGIWGGLSPHPGPLPEGEGVCSGGEVGQPDSLSTENVAVQARPIAASKMPMNHFSIVLFEL